MNCIRRLNAVLSTVVKTSPIAKISTHKPVLPSALKDFLKVDNLLFFTICMIYGIIENDTVVVGAMSLRTVFRTDEVTNFERFERLAKTLQEELNVTFRDNASDIHIKRRNLRKTARKTISC